MRRIIYTLALGVVMAAPCTLLPFTSKANGPTDARDPGQWYWSRDVSGRAQWMERQRLLCDPFARPMAGTSVPLNGGQIFLILAGLGLGAKMLYDRRKLGVKVITTRE